MPVAILFYVFLSISLHLLSHLVLTTDERRGLGMIHF
jgi:hypothetical protein